MPEDITTTIDRIKLTRDIFEKGRLLKFLMKEKNMRMKDLAELLDMQPSYVAHYLRLNKLPEIIIDGYYAKQISASHLFIIARLHDYVTMLTVYEQVLGENLTSPQTEAVVRELLYHVKTEGGRLTDDEQAHFVRLFKQRLGTKVGIHITQTRIKSTLVIEQKGTQEETTAMLRKLYTLLSEKPG